MSSETISSGKLRGLRRIWAWLSSEESYASTYGSESEAVDWVRSIPFWLFHLACLSVFWTGVSTAAVLYALGAFWVRMFFITAFYHRYFSHRSFQAGRVAQFLFALLGCTAGQRGPLWWASHHRQHHGTADTPSDPHSPAHKGLLFAHTLWFLTPSTFTAPKRYIRDWQRWPELVWLEKVDWVPFVLFGAFSFALGEWLGEAYGTSGLQFLAWGFFLSTTVLYHATYSINSLAHTWGTRRFETRDQSRNNVWLALLTLGEGWHNNHHRYPASARQGFFWWEIDISYLLLRLMSALSLIGELRPVPQRVLEEADAGSGRLRRT
jgi:stearoyl-CoA desaturase (delta-9 desaturase)